MTVGPVLHGWPYRVSASGANQVSLAHKLPARCSLRHILTAALPLRTAAGDEDGRACPSGPQGTSGLWVCLEQLSSSRCTAPAARLPALSQECPSAEQQRAAHVTPTLLALRNIKRWLLFQALCEFLGELRRAPTLLWPHFCGLRSLFRERLSAMAQVSVMQRACLSGRLTGRGAWPKRVCLRVTDGASRCVLGVANRLHAQEPNATVATVVDARQGVNEPAPWKWEESDDSTLAYGVMAMVLAAGALPPVQVSPGGFSVRATDTSPAMNIKFHLIGLPAQANQLADLPYFISLALATMYIGAHRGLTTNQRQMISLKESALAPILASVSLFVCYLIVKYLPDLSLQTFLNCYFWLLGSIAALGATGPLLRKVAGPLGKQV